MTALKWLLVALGVAGAVAGWLADSTPAFLLGLALALGAASTLGGRR